MRRYIILRYILSNKNGNTDDHSDVRYFLPSQLLEN